MSDSYTAMSNGQSVSYVDNIFKGENNITHVEVVTIVSCLLERKADTEYIDKNLSLLTKFKDMRNNNYWAYYEVMESANNHSIA